MTPLLLLAIGIAVVIAGIVLLRLHAALRQMLGQMPLRDISVEALVRQAGVTRPTFYAHFTDVPEMLGEYLDHLLAEMSRHFTLQPGDVVLTGTPAGVGPLPRNARLSLQASFGLEVSTRTR